MIKNNIEVTRRELEIAFYNLSESINFVYYYKLKPKIFAKDETFSFPDFVCVYVQLIVDGYSKKEFKK